jgi:multidrug efflux pump subunit AcrA (membrane-fusion protein)
MQALRMLAISRDSLSVLLGPQGVIEMTDAESQPEDAPAPVESAPAAAAKPVSENPQPETQPPPAETPPAASTPAASDTPPATGTPPAAGSPPAAGRRSEPSSALSESSKNLSEFAVQAPFAGRVERRGAVRSARIEAGKPLFVLADTAKLLVEAEIHERDWAVLEHASEGEIAIRVPALGEQPFATRTRYVGAEVSSASRSVPLVTEVDNAEGRLKPGMFVWVEAPLGKVRDACLVPAGAIMRHEGQAFVFVPLGGDRYRRVDVQTGLETREHIEIRSGLEPGQEVVARGAFYLKSELLLEKEAD